MSTIYDVLDHLRGSAVSEADKGARFERLMRAYLRTDPVFAEQFSDVWLWSDYPDRTGPDTGIDLVARRADGSGDVAVQCKFFAPDTYVTKPMLDSFLAASGMASYVERMIISTSDKWGANAESAIHGQSIPVRRLGMDQLAASRVTWPDVSVDMAFADHLELVERKHPRKHQRVAIDKTTAGFAEHDRGKLVMACGTGKTFTSLRLAEEYVGAGSTILFLVPSINLLSQTVREWTDNASLPIRPLAVCSDPRSTSRNSNLRGDFDDISVTDLVLPATTNVERLRARIETATSDTGAMTVIFATYQSIDIVAQSWKGRRPLDLVIADEAHRTTGITLADDKRESSFVRVHDDEYLPAAKRLYMTATPRIYDDATKAKAGEANAVLASMDDESRYGPEFHRLGFGEAVEKELLTDYKVLVLTVDESSVARTFQQQLSDDGNELKLDDAAKIVGCWNGLAKRGRAEHSFEPDVAPMRRAIAFAGQIADSKRIEKLFQDVTDHYVDATDQQAVDGSSPLKCEVRHVDGTMNALQRNGSLDWLRGDPASGSCRILTNARCLSEGVDVPALDAVMFLSPRKSVVDIVQSVGRVMRRDPAGSKDYGYIILPIGIPSGMIPEDALRDNKRYAVVWEVLQALRAHDERFDALVNRIQLSKARDSKVNVIGVGGEGSAGEQGILPLAFGDLDQWRNAIYAKIVQKVGSREYWTDWAKDVAQIAERQITRIESLLAEETTSVRAEFDTFLDGLRGNLNEGIREQDAVEMLAQHLITRPVFNALFAGDEFLDHNPVAQTMERMLAVLDQHDLEAENEALGKFYDSVRRKVRDVKDREGRQELVRRLYDTFFATAFRKTADKLGIVYTPVEIVDFILRSADDLLRQEFGQSITDEGVHILDGFTGTGTFIVRLLELGLVRPHDLTRKYVEEMHANEILLLAYYIAAVNIETTYRGMLRESGAEAPSREGISTEEEPYESFPGLILTDTFQSWEDSDRPDLSVFPENNDRLERLKQLPITVIVGNPPYSIGQESANDRNQNERYPSLDENIRQSYAARSESTSLRSLYDSYVRAIRWATLRIREKGIVAYVTNGGFLDSNTADGMRKTLADEFTSIYIVNLRGNQRTAGDESRREGGKIFGGGSRATVAITLLVKNPARKSPAQIRYLDIGDYLTREEKLSRLRELGSVADGVPMGDISPNAYGDWLSKRGADFDAFLPLTAKDGTGIFKVSSHGLTTNRDPWVYNFGKEVLARNVRTLVSNFNSDIGIDQPSDDPTRVSWSRALRSRWRRGDVLRWDPSALRGGMYRPFCKQNVYFSPGLNEVQAKMNRLFPSPDLSTVGFIISGPYPTVKFSALAADAMPDLNLFTASQFYPRWTYESMTEDGTLALNFGEEAAGYRRVDNISDAGLSKFVQAYGDEFGKDEIFSYVYGVLHSPAYRDSYAADLKKTIPRVPLAVDPWPFVRAGRDLADLHLNYESETPYPLDGLDIEPTGDPYDFFGVQKMAFVKKRDPESKKLVSDRTAIIYNSRIRLSGIPEDAYRFMLGSRSAIEWIIDRYQVRTDKSSGIVNDPNEWSRESGDPRYIIDLLARVVAVSLRTMQIVDALPSLSIREDFK
ncbi:DEAD/DEAH box helicase family protein [Actinomycetospora endophytica]|uniref:DEAD/DEAH box helicase family protein n=1 Tax=Actinomycetospora endophytica TaxID=2291215 RepID=A0ABS8PKE6_9PSEU|nr:type ISP restriction/modification enzyme [Actinomycetospora endophytica]MCD2197891.1 DEAD/DEAH box helicase family protein [Actinomycetospora endophytica]